MDQKKFTVAIIGVGSRGGNAYGKIINLHKDKFEIVALCDTRAERLDIFGSQFGVKEENRFVDEKIFFEKKRADLLLIATLDADHVRQCLTAFALGYDVLCEKPLTDKREECEQLLAAQKKYGNKVLVCHVLRYAPAFLKVSELLEQNEIGTLVAIEALERVEYWHQAHSYVRGNWRRREETTPMLLAKCCHDLDLIQYYANSQCKSISSIGDLRYFKKENQPIDAADRCLDCKYINSCPYSAKRIYIDMWKIRNSAEDIWPQNVAVTKPITEEKLQKAIQEGPYGRCVFRCDNDVVDHQITQMTFQNGIKATLTMTAFTARGGRRMSFYGTNGEMVLDEAEHTIRVQKFGEAPYSISLENLNEEGFGHGGGDSRLIKNLYTVLCGEEESRTSLAASVESHLMGIYAEESRLNGGVCVQIRD